MKIAILSHLKFPICQPFAGGLERHTHELTRSLRERGHHVVLFAAEGTDPALHPVTICAPTGEARGEDEARDAQIDPLEAAAYAAIMDQVDCGGFDVVHNNCLHPLPLERAQGLGAPMVTVLHTPPFSPFVNGVRAAAGRQPIVAVSDALAREWEEIVPDVAVVENGVDLLGFAYRSHAPEPRYAIWSGRVVPEKGLHLAIDAARLAGLELRFAGPRTAAAYWAEEIAPRLGPGIVDLGHLGQAELAAKLGAASVAVTTPRWEEPFGLVVVEALACGTPVAGFRRGALPDILDQRTGRLADPDNVRDLARAISEAAHLSRAACRERVETAYDLQVMIDRYETLYRTVRRRPVAAVHSLAVGVDA